MKLLVVDDESGICDFLRGFFAERGYDVCVANRGEEAMRLIEEENPKIVLLDIRMPGMNGIEVLKKAKEGHPDMKIIMVTAIENDDMIDLALQYGAEDYIIKPFSLEHLEEIVVSRTIES
ncbi:MAG: response regulator [Candidatus Omnitrophica bacterium]|nr:response regulator [Candidatus Omnitrophota bacterium]